MEPEETGGKKRKQAPPGRTKRATARSLMRQAYDKLQERMKGKENGKLIEELGKLIRLERELSGEKQGVKKIKVRWESEGKSSKGE